MGGGLRLVARGTRRMAMTVGERGGSMTQSWSADVAGVSMVWTGKRGGAGAGPQAPRGARVGLAS